LQRKEAAMLRRLLFAILLGLSFGAHAQLFPFQLSAVDTTNLAVTSSAQNITLPSAQAGPVSRQIVFSQTSGTQTVFIRCDGATATVSNAMPIMANSQFILTHSSAATCSAIAVGTGSTLYTTSGIGQ
jgi:hypothetical protein